MNNNRTPDLAGITKNFEIQLTVKYIRSLMRELGLPLETVFRILQISKRDQTTYTRIITKQLPKGRNPAEK